MAAHHNQVWTRRSPGSVTSHESAPTLFAARQIIHRPKEGFGDCLVVCQCFKAKKTGI